MKYDKNLVGTIIENEFYDDLYNYIAEIVEQLDGRDLDEAFDMYVDYAELDNIQSVNIQNVEQENEEKNVTIHGELEAEIFMRGYVYFDGENHCVGEIDCVMELSFLFMHDNGKNYGFEVREI